MTVLRSWTTPVLIPFILMVAACSDEGDPAAPGDRDPDGGTTVSFVSDVQPIFDARCTVCHGAGGNGGLDLRAPQSYANLADFTSPNYGAKRAAPGEPENSVLIDKIEGGGRYGSRMPPTGAALSSTDIATIRQWVAEGALPE